MNLLLNLLYEITSRVSRQGSAYMQRHARIQVYTSMLFLGAYIILLIILLAPSKLASESKPHKNVAVLESHTVVESGSIVDRSPLRAII